MQMFSVLHCAKHRVPYMLRCCMHAIQTCPLCAGDLILEPISQGFGIWYCLQATYSMVLFHTAFR